MAEFGKQAVFCLDTNILIQMKGLIVNEEAEIKSMDNAGVTESIRQIYHLIKTGKLIPVITPTVLKEVLHGVSYFGYDLVDFLRDNNFFVFEVARNEKEYWRKTTNRLACAYCETIKTEEVKEINRLFGAVPGSYAKSVFPVKVLTKNKIVPINDARIMAESTFVGLPLITNNIKDFTLNNRPNIIAYINQKHNFKKSSRPYTSKEFLEFYHGRNSFPKIIKRHEQNLTNSDDCEFLM